jgi:hypothetical protein
MNTILRSFLDLVFGNRGNRRGTTLEEESYPRDAMGRPELSRFTKPVAHYASYFDDYLASLGPQGPASSTAQQLAYRKSVLAQWGLIAKGPRDALPYVKRLLARAEPEARSAAAAVLEAWTGRGSAFVPELLAAAASETDPETLSTLISALAAAHTQSALPLFGRILRDPASRHGDVHWAAVEGLGRIAGRRFELSEEGLRDADAWLREHGA